MKQDERSVVREAQRHAQQDLLHEGFIRPAVFMLVRCNPQTGAPMSRPAAIGHVLDGSSEDGEHTAWLDAIRSEAKRLGALAVALCVEAEAEVDDGQSLRVAMIHVEDEHGLEVLHAPIDRTGVGARIGTFVALAGAEASEATGIPALLGE
ncbi:MAG: hypothetical protein OXU20_21995 [Myxococcales bacterium]|nr:hypothetical protein [Myxococcales bacterium]